MLQRTNRIFCPTGSFFCFRWKKKDDPVPIRERIDRIAWLGYWNIKETQGLFFRDICVEWRDGQQLRLINWGVFRRGAALLRSTFDGGPYISSSVGWNWRSASRLALHFLEARGKKERKKERKKRLSTIQCLPYRSVRRLRCGAMANG